MELHDKDLVFFIHPESESGCVCHKDEDLENMDPNCEEVSQAQWMSILRAWGHDVYEMKRKDIKNIKKRIAEKRDGE